MATGTVKVGEFEFDPAGEMTATAAVPEVRFWIFPVTRETEGLRGWYRTLKAAEAAARELWRNESRWIGLTVVGGTDRADATERARRVMRRAAVPGDAKYMKPSTYRYAAGAASREEAS